MSLKIRLARGGAKKRPFYRIVVADSRMPRDGRFKEKIGTYNPMVPREHDQRLVLKEERVKYWLSVGAQPTDRVARMLSQLGFCEKPVVREQTKQSKPKQKAQERLKEREEKAAAAAEAANAEGGES